MADFVDGAWLEAVERQYGEIIKISFDVENFINFIQGSKHIKVGNNGRKYLNVEIKRSRGGKPYMAVDTWQPKSNSDKPDGDTPF